MYMHPFVAPHLESRPSRSSSSSTSSYAGRNWGDVPFVFEPFVFGDEDFRASMGFGYVSVVPPKDV